MILSVQALLGSMEQLERLHRELLDLAEEKVPVLIGNDIDSLNRIVHREHQLTKQIVECEASRQTAADRFLVSKGFRPNPAVTVTDLIKLAFKAEDKKALMECQEGLLATLKKLKEANERNQRLLEQSIVFVNFSLDLIIGPPEDDVIYQNPGLQGAALKRPGMFDTRA